MSDRRQFLKRASALAAGALLMPKIVSAAGEKKLKAAGFQLWSIAKYLEKDFDASLKMIAELGYKHLELFGPYPFSSPQDKASWNAITRMVGFSQSGYFNRSVTEFKTVLKRYGLATPAMHIGLDTLRNNLEETAAAANILGQQYVGIASIPEPERKTIDDYKRIAEEFNTIGAKAKALGIRFYYHNHGYGLKPVDGVTPFDIILKQTDPSLVFFEMDLFWTIAGGGDPITYLKAHPGRFKLLHIKDMTKQVAFSGDGSSPQQWVELFPYITDAGSGVLDLKTILVEGKESGVDHFIIENDVVVDPKTSLKKGYDFLSSIDFPK